MMRLKEWFVKFRKNTKSVRKNTSKIIKSITNPQQQYDSPLHKSYVLSKREWVDTRKNDSSTPEEITSAKNRFLKIKKEYSK